ncbi:hypothetical protein Y1Q_0012845 [Alligator mississippiensis]|uniref:Uncharacterized protein n=1 Tax=Alligator mississippiensis TaxID=8496 RepID=A0A151P482_ALLMI|nr:hypothetical protein Y1Q_0012845 [Alligator mississippiensis]
MEPELLWNKGLGPTPASFGVTRLNPWLLFWLLSDTVVVQDGQERQVKTASDMAEALDHVNGSSIPLSRC